MTSGIYFRGITFWNDKRCSKCNKFINKNRDHNCIPATKFRCIKCGQLVSKRKQHTCPEVSPLLGKPNPSLKKYHWKKLGINIWNNPKFREKNLKAKLKGLLKRPTSLEREFIEFIENYNLPLKYVGNGSQLIGFRNPDFVSIWDNIKCCIETANYFHHQGDYAEKRIQHFAKYGWRCMVIFASRKKKKDNWIKNEKEVLRRVHSFIWGSIPEYKNIS